jgi:hypothetical protein
MGALAVIAVVIILVLAGVGVYLVYERYFAPGHPTYSQNWAGYEDQNSVGSASGSITVPSSSSWNGNGVVGLWVGMGGSSGFLGDKWPFWQAGATVTCSAGVCQAELFDEGGTRGAPCNGVCPVNWSQDLGLDMGASVTISIYGNSSGAIAVLTVLQDGITTTYNPPAWTVLAGVTAFPSAEWIFESPTGPNGVEVMPTLSPPGVTFSAMNDSASVSALGPVLMQGNPNGQSVNCTSVSGGTFSAYSYDT